MLERELKMGAGPGFRLPDLGGVADGVQAIGRPARDLATTYLDTPDLRLARWGCSLRYRQGDGWTVKVPVATEGHVLTRAEHTFPGDGRRPPGQALDLVRGYLRGAPLQPVANLRTRRAGVTLVGAAGEPLAEVVDDEVSVFDGRRVAARFREVEVEVTEDMPAPVLAAVVARLRGAGAGEPDPTSKVVRALGPRALDPPDVVVDGLGPEPSAADVIRHALAASVVRLLRHDAGIRTGEDPEDVHQARVATRRLRSDLRTFRPFVERAWADGVREELRWLGGELGAVRDTEVLMGRIRGRATEVRERGAPVVERLALRLAEERERHRARLLSAIREDRYSALLDSMVAAARDPALLDDAAGPATALPPLVLPTWRHLRTAVRDAGDEPADEALHLVRIRAKRTRYAADAVAPVAGRPARTYAQAAARLQDVLGEHQDAVVAEGWVRTAAAGTSPRVAFVAGQLVELEREAARRARAGWREAWAPLSKKRVRAWMQP